MKKITSTVDISERIRLIRKASQLSQMDFAKKVGISNSTLKLLEANNNNSFPSYELIIKLCREFNIYPSYFFDEGNVKLEDYLSIDVNKENRKKLIDELKKDNESLLEIYGTLDAIKYLSTSLRNFLPTIGIDDIHNFKKSSDALTQISPFKLEYEEYRSVMLDHLTLLKSYKEIILEFSDQLTNFLAKMKDLDNDNKLPQFNPVFWPKK